MTRGVLRRNHGGAVSRTSNVSGSMVGSKQAALNARRLLPAVSLAVLIGSLLSLVWLYAAGLRDPRYLDGWILAGAMAFQIGFHATIKMGRLSPRSFRAWRRLHILTGYFLVAAFASHCDFSLPDSAFEWAMWLMFVLITLSGVFGTYLEWSLKSKGGVGEGITCDRIPALRSALARNMQTIMAGTPEQAPTLPLPGLPHDDWIADLYSAHLREFFRAPRNSAAHLIGSTRPLRQLTDEIDRLAPFVDHGGKQKLDAIKALVVEKDRLDFAQANLGLSKAWLFIHVPATYAMIVLACVHIITVYAFTSGGW